MELASAAPVAAATGADGSAPATAAPVYSARVYSFDMLNRVLQVAGEAGKMRELQELIQSG